MIIYMYIVDFTFRARISIFPVYLSHAARLFNHMYNILMPVSGSEEKGQKFVETVQNFPVNPGETNITILNVFEEFEVMSAEWRSISSDEFYDRYEFPVIAGELAANIQKAGFEVDVLREHGDPATVIIETASETDADMIIMAGRNQSPIGKAFFGSVTQAVLLDSKVPVTVVPSAD